ncbi:uncharacterized protein LOC129750800 [Uranotaenia lowii]|uniref:uncharacterized protein LOC129750800 n=1 Tax=Uranotaenia lowii TaxID=190385 RepID=UPI00247B2262|nr:uncharacterized protein LOC129750800 [Uranotaenia lowii]
MSRPPVSCVKWVDFSDHMFDTFLNVYAQGLFTDVTLVVANGGQLKACRMVLSMASKFFEDIFVTAFGSMGLVGGEMVGGMEHVIKIVIPDVSYAVMKHVLHFIYTGEVQMNARDMSDFFEACQMFRLKGLDYTNGNISGVKIGGSNIITTEQYDYEELQDDVSFTTEDPTTVEGLAIEETDVTVAVDSMTTEGDVLQKIIKVVQPEPETEKKSASEVENLTSFYEVQLNMGDLTATANDASIAKTSVLDSFDMDSEDMTPETSDFLTPSFDNDNDGGESSSAGQSSNKKRIKNCEYGERLEEAIESIVQGRTSFRTASIQYGIPKTVLWRKAIKVPNYKAERQDIPSPRKEAIEALKSGEKLLTISKRFDIPLSTLHRDKMKLFHEGTLPENVALMQRDKGSDFKDRVFEAALQCLNGSLSQSEAAKFYKLPKTTIWRKIRSLRSTSGSDAASCSTKIENQTDETQCSSERITKLGLIEMLDDQESEPLSEDDESLEPEYVVLV